MKPRPIRSFVRRSGHLDENRRQALAALSPIYLLSNELPIDLNQLFQNTNPTTLEIGFGMGKTLIDMAKASPDHNFIGIDVHQPGVAVVLREIAAQDLHNLRVCMGDAVEILPRVFASQRFARIHIFFPDPWPKLRHQKRRLIQKNFVETLLCFLEPKGRLHLATDNENYADHMLQTLSGIPALKNSFPETTYAPVQYERTETKYEARGLRLGHRIFEFVFEKI